ncbi:MAG: hypothetical protein JW893_05605 [Candidatus Omnitrophica bacterium]|nr:hypothetical protein [Candidatus Omnitrophota bacterium]
MSLKISKFHFFLLSLIFIRPQLGHADDLWPALYLESKLLSVWVVSAGLILEYVFIRRITGWGIQKSLIADVVMNTVSVSAGFIMIPFLGYVWEIFYEAFFEAIWGESASGLVSWVVTCWIAGLIYTAVEAGCLKGIFKVFLDPRRFWMLCLANLAVVFLAWAFFRI